MESCPKCESKDIIEISRKEELLNKNPYLPIELEPSEIYYQCLDCNVLFKWESQDTIYELIKYIRELYKIKDKELCKRCGLGIDQPVRAKNPAYCKTCWEVKKLELVRKIIEL